MEPTTPTEPKAKGNWWTRNWKWFVPTGCFTILVLFLVFVASIVIIVFGAIKSTDPYKDAIARAKIVRQPVGTNHFQFRVHQLPLALGSVGVVGSMGFS